jgi:hypothetical protein
MTILRTDGTGSFKDDSRLQEMKELLHHFSLNNKIDHLHDHKGNLTVNWNVTPTVGDLIIVNRTWAGFGETQIEHLFDKMNIFIDTKEFDR